MRDCSPVLGPEAFDFELPPQQIAQHPASRRGAARMLVLEEAGVLHRRADELAEVLPEHALVVVNNSRVVPARVHLRCVAGKGEGRVFEVLVCSPGPEITTGAVFPAWVRGARRLAAGDQLDSGEGFRCTYLGAELPVHTPDQLTSHANDPRVRWFQVEAGDLLPTLRAHGEVPLPPYIRRPEGPDGDDAERYQTLFAEAPGSVAAPTAGLHWEPEVLAKLDRVALTLHVGPGTFLPMDVADVREHRVGSERVSLSAEAAAKILEARQAGRPIVAIGTTATRALEGIAARRGRLEEFRGNIDLVITPGHRFQVVDCLVTNFHLPRSSLLMLVCALGGRERVLEGYRTAVAAGYRFYSYGDCMVVPAARRDLPCG
ncbi:MAG: tRNA preQ1(34) S-adenosylmethionine ribosyltransferase-isomerase QueA [Nannocystaceae bacterium]